MVSIPTDAKGEKPMPTPWKRSPEELHKTYIANTEAFYKVAGRGLAQELDEFVVSCALGLWKGSPRLGQQHVDAVNQLYSKGRKSGAYLLWELTEKVCRSTGFLPPLFLLQYLARERILLMTVMLSRVASLPAFLTPSALTMTMTIRIQKPI